MIGTRHEEYNGFTNGLPFILNADIKRNRYNRSRENNWHENIELQICLKGNGTVLLDGKKYPFYENDIIAVNSNVIHYTDTDTELIYDCVIISTEFCDQMGLNPTTLFIKPFIQSDFIADLLKQLKTIYSDNSLTCRTAKLNKIILEVLIELAENHNLQNHATVSKRRKFETVKNTINYIRQNYNKKITLAEISKAVLCDKYTLCKDFKKLTGQTIIENLHNYRCIKAIDFLSAGYTVGDTALKCGFENLSFFTKTFKKHIGKLPSQYKKSPF